MNDNTESTRDRDVSDRIDDALRRNHRVEILIISLLSVLFLVGLALLAAAAMLRQWYIAGLGGLCEAAIVFPINSLVKLRRENLRLQIIPELIRFADEAGSSKAKQLVVELVTHLIKQV